MQQTICMNGLQESAPVIEFPSEYRRQLEGKNGDVLTYIDGLDTTMRACYDQEILPGESDMVSWAKTGKLVDLRNYSSYPSRD